MSGITRRRVMQGLLAWGLLPATARAAGFVGAARLDVGLPDPRPGALEWLLSEARRQTSMELDPVAPTVDPASPELFACPFVVLTGDAQFEPLSDVAVDGLRLFLREGGCLFIDDASGEDRSGFDRSVRRLLGRALPGSKVVAVGRDHAVYRSFYLLRTVSGRLRVRPHLEGIWVGDITPVLYSHNDLFGALQPGGGRWARDVVPGGERQRREAIKLAINVLLFAVTSNYKRDAVHVETLLRRMRRQGGYDR